LLYGLLIKSPKIYSGKVVRAMSVKRTTWLVEILERAKRNLDAGQHKAAGTRLDLALTIGRELLKRAKGYQKRDMEAKK